MVVMDSMEAIIDNKEDLDILEVLLMGTTTIQDRR